MATKGTVSNNRLKLANNNLICTFNHAFASVAVVPDYGLKCLMFYRGSEQQTTIFFSFYFNFKLVL